MKNIRWAVFTLLTGSLWLSGYSTPHHFAGKTDAFYFASLQSSATWIRTDDTSGGSVDLTRVTSIEFRSEVWNYGYTMWIDGLTLGVSEVTENNATNWGTYDSMTPTSGDSVSNDATDKKVGSYSIKFVTDSGGDSGCFYPKNRNALWDFTRISVLGFQMKKDNVNPLKWNSPVVILTTASGGKVRFDPVNNLLTTSWTFITLPLNEVSLNINPAFGYTPQNAILEYGASGLVISVSEYRIDADGDGFVDFVRTSAGSVPWIYSTVKTYIATLTVIDTRGAQWATTSSIRIDSKVQPKVRGASGDLLADVIVGKPDFTEINPYEVSPNTLFRPGGAIIDRVSTTPKLYLNDTNNNRILGFDWNELLNAADLNSVLPKIVLGQPSFYTSGANGDSGFQNYPNQAPASASTLRGFPEWGLSIAEGGGHGSMSIDSQGNLYVFDYFNHRVLKYNKPFETDTVADYVWGQSDFTGNQPNKGMSSPDATTLHYDWGFRNAGHAGVEVDSSGNVWVADIANHRVLRFPPNSKTADLVLGQSNFTSGGPFTVPYTVDANGNVIINESDKLISPNRFNCPGAVRVNSQGWVYVSDQGNDRVIRFKPPFSNGMNGEVFGSGFVMPGSIDFDPTEPGQVWIQNRAARELWDETSKTKVKQVGISGDYNTLGHTAGMGIDSAGNMAFTSGLNNNYANKALIYLKGADGTFSNFPSKVFMQSDSKGNKVTRAGLGEQVTGVVVADNQLIISGGGRILFWNNPASVTSGQPADGYISGFTNTTINSFESRDGVLWFIPMKADKNHRLWVHSGVKNKLLVYQLPLVTGATPILEISPTINVLGGGTTTWSSVMGLVPTDNSEFLWISDHAKHRVLRIRNPLTSPIVDVVLGQTSITGTYPNRDSNWEANGSIPSTDPTTLAYPGFVSIDRSGNLWVSDHWLEAHGNGRLLEFNMTLFASNNTSVIFATAASKKFQDTATWEPAFNSQNQMVVGYNPYRNNPHPVLDTITGWKGGLLLGFYDNPLAASTSPSAFSFDYYSMPFAATFDGLDNLYVADLNRARVLIYKGVVNPFKLDYAKVTGVTSGQISNSYSFSASLTTLDGASVQFVFNWGDATSTTTAFVASGATAAASHSWSSAGTYTVQVQAVDSNGKRSGWFSMTVTITAMADIVISDIYIPFQVEQGKVLTLLEAISNNGTTGASSFTVTYSISSASLPSTQLGSRTVTSLPSSATDFKAVQLSIPSTLADGSYTLTVTVDSGNTVAESNETNNTLTKTINITKFLKYDFDGNDQVGIEDILAVVQNYGWIPGDLYYNPAYDLNKSNGVGIEDILAVVSYYGTDPRLPKADLKVNYATVATGNPVTITYDKKETEANIVKYELDYTVTAGYEVTSSTPGSVTHTYTVAGTYTVTLKVTDEKGQTDTTSATINVITFSTAAPSVTATANNPYISVTVNWTGGSSPYWRVYRGGVLLTTVTNARTYTDNTVAAGTSYGYYVQASKDSGGSVIGTSSNTVNVTSDPSTPTLTRGAVTSFSIALSWSTPPGQVSIERGYTNTSLSEITTTVAGATSYTDNAVVPGKTYYYRIRFTGGGGKYGKYSSVVSGATPAMSITASAVVTSGQTNSITVTWNTTGTSGVSVLIERDNVQVGSVAGNNTSYVDLVVGGSHSYRVRYSDNKGGYSVYSNTTASVAPAASSITPVITASGINGVSAGGLSWSPLNPAAYPNALLECKDPTQTTFSEITNTTQVASIKGQLVAGTSYKFKMRFTNSARSGVSNYSSEVTFSTPAPVLSAVSSAGSVTLTISGTTSPYFMIYRSTDGVNFSQVGYTGTTSFTDSGLTSGTTYHYYVKSWNQGLPSNTVNAIAQ